MVPCTLKDLILCLFVGEGVAEADGGVGREISLEYLHSHK